MTVSRPPKNMDSNVKSKKDAKVPWPVATPVMSSSGSGNQDSDIEDDGSTNEKIANDDEDVDDDDE